MGGFWFSAHVLKVFRNPCEVIGANFLKLRRKVSELIGLYPLTENANIGCALITCSSRSSAISISGSLLVKRLPDFISPSFRSSTLRSGIVQMPVSRSRFSQRKLLITLALWPVITANRIAVFIGWLNGAFCNQSINSGNLEK